MKYTYVNFIFFFFQAEDGIRDYKVTGVQTCALPISMAFAGMLGLALQSRIADRVAVRAAVAMLVAAVASVLVWLHGGNLLPWALVQGGGMLAVLGLACVAPRHGALALRLGVVIAWYGAAKLPED